MSPTAPAVVVMARAPRRGMVHQALEPLLGADGALALHTALLLRAIGWARAVADGRVYVAYEPADAQGELRTLLGQPATYFPQSGEGIASRTAAACAHVFAAGDRPLLLLWPDLARLGPEHAAAALDDLGAGCDIVLGPVFDGGLYLIGVARPVPALFALPEKAWRSPDLVTQAVAAAHGAGLNVGLLRAERALHRPADARAALADPLLPAQLARILSRGRPPAN
jgi:glycosyltransferase A (GT-A) superfamily protein (DUF2064 family)